MAQIGTLLTIRRLRALSILFVAASLVLADSIGATLLGSEQIAFKVYRDGEPLGRHEVAFREEDGMLHVEVDIELEVRLAFIPLFSYRHSNREVWKDGRLLSIETETDDDGERYWMRGLATENGFSVDGSSGRFLAPADVVPTSYWNPKTVESSPLLDTQYGRLVEVEAAPTGVEVVPVAGRDIEAQRYRLTGDLTLDLWYTAEGEWAKTTFEARGAEVTYERQNLPDRQLDSNSWKNEP
ncbi:MAG: DUF6134 family protein [Pseudomonadota bacterium]